jgi:hypothetical protein
MCTDCAFWWENGEIHSSSLQRWSSIKWDPSKLFSDQLLIALRTSCTLPVLCSCIFLNPFLLLGYVLRNWAQLFSTDAVESCSNRKNIFMRLRLWSMHSQSRNIVIALRICHLSSSMLPFGGCSSFLWHYFIMFEGCRQLICLSIWQDLSRDNLGTHTTNRLGYIGKPFKHHQISMIM